MFDHVKFGVSDYAASRSFFIAALKPLGVTDVREWPPDGVELSQPKGTVSLCMYQSKAKPAHLHLAFSAASRKQVQDFYRAAFRNRRRNGARYREQSGLRRRTSSAGGEDQRATRSSTLLITPATTLHSSLALMGTTSKLCAMKPRPNHSLNRSLRRPVSSNVSVRFPRYRTSAPGRLESLSASTSGRSATGECNRDCFYCQRPPASGLIGSSA